MASGLQMSEVPYRDLAALVNLEYCEDLTVNDLEAVACMEGRRLQDPPSSHLKQGRPGCRSLGIFTHLFCYWSVFKVPVDIASRTWWDHSDRGLGPYFE